ncbi:MAG TPA: S16 family serine protease [Nitrospiraceae bacterium]|nr:S16 family serine protease [Nitrospiraceae bacterium]
MMRQSAIDAAALRWCALFLAAVLLTVLPSSVEADATVEVPVLAVIRANNQGVFNVMVLNWDRRSSPDPMELKWGNRRIRIKEVGLGSIEQAFLYAIDHTPSVRYTGTLTLYGASYAPLSSDGPSAGAVMTVGFLAVLRGDPIIRGIALTGTLESDGRIGPVGGIPDKVRAAAREHYRMVLVPQGQLNDPRWDLIGLGMQLNLTIKEVNTVQEAYEIMTERKL